ncbi:MAG: MarR family winged helix-turn-helix transcriptional regulator [Coprobacillus sp.]
MIPSLSYYSTLLRKDFIDYCNHQLLEMDLSQGLLFYILYVGKHPNCSPKQLTQALHMDTGHTTRSLSKLQQSGFIKQENNPHDKRAHVLNLTPKGEQAFKTSHDLFLKWDQEVMNELSKDEQTQLLSLLKKVSYKKEKI